MVDAFVTDIDNVVYNWDLAFDKWLVEQGYTQQEGDFINTRKSIEDFFNINRPAVRQMILKFNKTHTFDEMIDGSIDALEKIKDKTHELVAITSCGSNNIIAERRHRNMGHLFDKMHILKLGSHKRYVLSHYSHYNEPVMFVDDSIGHVMDSNLLGLDGWLFDSMYNTEVDYNKRISSWDQIIDKLSIGE